MERLKCGAVECWSISVVLIMWEMEKYYSEWGGALILYRKKRKRKAKSIAKTLHWNCLLIRIILGKIEGKIKVTGRQGRRRMQLLDDLTGNRSYCELKEEALVRSSWRSGFWGNKDLFKQTSEWLTEWMNVYWYTALHVGRTFIFLASSNTFFCTVLPEV